MAIRWLSTAWKDDLKERAFPTERVYVDFRQEIYPPIGPEYIIVNVIEGLKLGEVVTEERHREVIEGIKIGDVVTGDTV